MDHIDALEQYLVQIKALEENPMPFTESIKTMETLYDIVSLHSENLTHEVVVRMERKLWQLIVVFQSKLKFSFYQGTKKYTLANFIFLILTKVIVLRHRFVPADDFKTCNDIPSLEPSLYFEKLAAKPIASYTLKECVESVTLLGTGFVQSHYHESIPSYLALLAYRLSEFCHYSMPYEEYQDVDFCNLVEQDEQSMGMVTFEFIQRVYLILYHMYYRLQSIYIVPMCNPPAISRHLQTNLVDLITQQVEKLVLAESGKTMREKYIVSQMRPGEREMFMLSDVHKTGYEDDQQIFLHFRGEAEFSRMFEYCQKPWAEIIRDEINSDDETIGLQMCTFDLLCMLMKNLKVPRCDLDRYMIWESDIPKRYAELVNEQTTMPYLVQVFNGVQLVHKNRMFMFNSLLRAFIKWVEALAMERDDENGLVEDDEEFMQLDGHSRREPHAVVSLSEQFMWKLICEGKKKESREHHRPPPTGFVSFKM